MPSILIENRGRHFERRVRQDRRALSFPDFKYWGRRGHRRQIRRNSDCLESYLDWYPAPVVWIMLLTLGLCSVDAVFTLTLLQRGAVEINPFMALLIDTNLPLFVGVKMVVTGLGLLCLVVHHNFTFLGLFRVQALIYAFAGLYFGIVVYEGGLLFAESFFDL